MKNTICKDDESLQHYLLQLLTDINNIENDRKKEYDEECSISVNPNEEMSVCAETLEELTDNIDYNIHQNKDWKILCLKYMDFNMSKTLLVLVKN